MDKSDVMERDKFLDEFIPSIDMRRCIQEMGREFTDFEKAAIIYNLKRPWKEKKAAFCNIMCQTKDETLKRQLAERISYDEECMALYAEKTAGYIYVLSCLEEEGQEICGYFADSDAAFSQGLKENMPFLVEKYWLIGREDTEIDSCAAWFSFDERGRLWTFESTEPNQEDPGDDSCFGENGISRFERIYVQFPNPFKRGDFVRVVEKNLQDRNADNLDVGIVATPHEQKRTLNLPEELDWSDMYIMVNFADKKVGFVHDHLHPIFLEKCPVPKGEQGERLLALRETMLREEWGEYVALMQEI